MPQELARVVGRAQRSAIGTWTFGGGGLVVEGGRKVGQGDPAPLLARLPFPPSWRCVVAVPDAPAGVSGAAEAQAMAQLPSPPEGDVERVAYLVLMGLLPALVEGDVATFGSSLSEIQETHRRVVGAGAGRHVRAGPVGRPRALHARVGRRPAWGRARGARPCTASSRARRPRRGWPSGCARRSALAASSTRARSAPTARVCGAPSWTSASKASEAPPREGSI